MAHGGGGKLMQTLIQSVFQRAFTDSDAPAAHDGAILHPQLGCRLAFTTDSYVIKPIFFPGGNIGRLAVLGTVNDLAM